MRFATSILLAILLTDLSAATMPVDVSLEPPQGIRRMIDTLDNVVRSTANYAAEGKLRRHLIAQSG